MSLLCVRAIALGLGLALAVAPEVAWSTDIPLGLADGANGVILTINVGIGGQAPRLYLFDTGSGVFNAGYSATAFGTVPQSTPGLPTNISYNYGDNKTGNSFIGNIVGAPSLTFYPTEGTAPGATLDATNASGGPADFLIYAATSHCAGTYNQNGQCQGTNVDVTQPLKANGTAFQGYYGIFGAGTVVSQLTDNSGVSASVGGVLGQAVVPGTTAGYVVAANGQPLNSIRDATGHLIPGALTNGPQAGQSVTSCSPCVMLGLTPALLAQFNTLTASTSHTQGLTFPNSGAPSLDHFPIRMQLTLSDGVHTPYTITQPTLLDTGTANIQFYVKNPGNDPYVTKVSNGFAVLRRGVTLTINNPPLASDTLFASGPYSVFSAGPTAKAPPSKIYYGLGFFLQNSVLFNLEGKAIGYTPNFVTDTNIATAAASPLVVNSSSVPLGLAGIISGPGGLDVVDGGSVTLSGTNTYTGPTIVDDGYLAIVGPGSIAASSGVQVTNSGLFDISGATNGVTAASLSGDATGMMYLGKQTLALSNASGSFAGVISGSGGLTLLSGTETLSGTNTYTGPTDLAGGTLVVTGDISASSNVTIGSGAMLSGTGTVPSFTAMAGATIAPGTTGSYGTLNVTGSATFLPGSTYVVGIDPTGSNDRITATGAAKLSNAAGVDVVAAPGVYSPKATYTILTAAGGVNGTFGPTASDLAFLVPQLSYDTQNVYLSFTQRPFTSVAATANELAVAGALPSLDPPDSASALYSAVLGQTVTGAHQALAALSGEIHASAVSAAAEDTRLPREAILDRLMQNPAPTAGSRSLPLLTSMPITTWGQAFGSFGRLSGNGNAATLDRTVGGLVLGADTDLAAGYRVGAVGGYTRSSLDVDARSSSGHVDTIFFGLYGATSFHSLQLRAGALYGFTRTGTQRTIAFPGFYDTASAGYGGETIQAFGEAGWRMPVFDTAFVEPFAGGLAMHIGSDRFHEAGNGAALQGTVAGFDTAATTLGLRAEMTPTPSLPFQVDTMLGWRHAFGDVAPRADLAFEAAPATSFAITGVPIARDALAVETGLNWKLGSRATAGLSYSGDVGRHLQDNAVKGEVEVTF